MGTLVLTDPKFLDHDPGPGHVESPARLDAIMGELGARADRRRSHRDAARRDRRRDRGGPQPRLPRAAGARSPASTRELDPDTAVSPGSWEAATLAAGAAVGAVEAVMHGRAAERLRAGASARAPRAARPGDGVLPAQQRRHRGRGGPARRRGAGAHRRLGRPPRQRDAGDLRGARRRPLHVGAPVSVLSGHGRGRGDRRRRGKRRDGQLSACPAGRTTPTTAPCSTICSCPVGRAFAPELIIVSAGFDAHERDPLAEMRVTERGFAAMTSALAELAERDLRRQAGAAARGGLRPGGAGGVGARLAGGADRPSRRLSPRRRDRRRPWRWRRRATRSGPRGRVVPKT